MLRLMMAMMLALALAACESRSESSTQVQESEQESSAATDSSGDDEVESDAAEPVDESVRYPYAAIVSCSTSSFQADLVACFSGSSSRLDTNLELKNGDKYDMYQPVDIMSLGKRTSEGVRIELSRNFEMTMQNASDSLILGVKIVNNVPSDDFGKVIFEKKVSEFGVIKVSN